MSPDHTLPPTRRERTRLRRARARRRTLGIALSALVLVGGVGGIAGYQLVSASAAAPSPAASTPAVSDEDRILATLSSTVDETTKAAGDTSAADTLTQARVTATAEGGTAGAASLTAAVETFRTDTVARGEKALSRYSDAASETEHALAAALDDLRSADVADLPRVVAEVEAARTAVIDDAKAYRTSLIEQSAGTNTQPTGGDVDAQLSYLMTYVFDYNDAEWGDYNDYGGDCTNFASQGLIARGWHIDDVWYSDGAMWTASKAWIATARMADYFDSLGFSYSTQDDLDRVRVGDIALFDWGETGAGYDHTMTVSKVEYTADGPVVSFVGHNEDGKYRELRKVLYEDHSDSTVRIYHIP